MKNYFGFNVKDFVELLHGKFRVFAEEPPTPPEPPAPPEPPNPPLNWDDLISKARKEEKDKLYPQIETLKTQVNTLTEKHNAQLLTIAEREKEAQDLKAEIERVKADKGKTDSEVVSNLKKKLKELETTLEQEQKNRIDPLEIENRIKSEYEVKLYREMKLREAGEEIIPELVFGDTKEAIDASIENAKNRFKEITGKVVKKTVHDTKVPNPPLVIDKEVDIKALSEMSMEDWGELRKKLGLK